jgi:hypothetical protein
MPPLNYPLKMNYKFEKIGTKENLLKIMRHASYSNRWAASKKKEQYYFEYILI